MDRMRAWLRLSTTAAALGVVVALVTGATSPLATGGPRVESGRLIGDGSTSDTGAQPGQPVPAKLEPGQAPPQFVVISWDGAGETLGLFEHFREVARKHEMSMTFFLTGLYLLPRTQKDRYSPPHRSAGASDVGYLSDTAIRATITQVREAWLEGHEIGTHFNGHFCGSKGVGSWTPADWDAEIAQAKSFVQQWRTNTGFTDLPALPFDYDAELVGARTPCLQGGAALVASSSVASWRYDSSGTGRQVWPTRFEGSRLWNIPMQAIPVAGRTTDFISMDYTFLANQSGTVDGDPAQRPAWREEMRAALVAGFTRAYDGNRAPLIIGNHFEDWNGGIYMQALEDAIEVMASKPDVRFVSFRQLCDWLDAQDPATLAALQRLDVGKAPAGGWARFRAS